MFRLLGLQGLSLLAVLSSATGAAAGEITATSGTLGLGTLVNGGRGCSSGACLVTGGTGAGSNLFHRFNAFDTRGAITGVTFQNTGFSAVMVGVLSPTVIEKTVALSQAGSLFWLSPGGISLQAGGNFQNVTNLSLSTATGLRVGTGLFDVWRTTSEQAALLSGAPVLGRLGLVSEAGSGLLQNGDLSIDGGLLTVDQSLLLDAQGGNVVLQAAELQLPGGVVEVSGRAVSISNSRIDVSDASGAGGSVAAIGETVTVSSSRIDASGGGGGGTLRLAARDLVIAGDSDGFAASGSGLDAATVFDTLATGTDVAITARRDLKVVAPIQDPEDSSRILDGGLTLNAGGSLHIEAPINAAELTLKGQSGGVLITAGLLASGDITVAGSNQALPDRAAPAPTEQIGVAIQSTAPVTSLAGSILIEGDSRFASDLSPGLGVALAGSLVAAGDIRVTGEGGSGKRAKESAGVRLLGQGPEAVILAGREIALTGQGGFGAGVFNDGINIENYRLFAGGDLRINAAAGSGLNQIGLFVDASSLAVGGTFEIRGLATQGGFDSNDFGIFARGTSMVSTATTQDSLQPRINLLQGDVVVNDALPFSSTSAGIYFAGARGSAASIVTAGNLEIKGASGESFTGYGLLIDAASLRVGSSALARKANLMLEGRVGKTSPGSAFEGWPSFGSTQTIYGLNLGSSEIRSTGGIRMAGSLDQNVNASPYTNFASAAVFISDATVSSALDLVVAGDAGALKPAGSSTTPGVYIKASALDSAQGDLRISGVGASGLIDPGLSFGNPGLLLDAVTLNTANGRVVLDGQGGVTTSTPSVLDSPLGLGNNAGIEMIASSLVAPVFELTGAGGSGLKGDGNGGVFLSKSVLVATSPSPSVVEGWASAGQDLNYGVIIDPFAGEETRIQTAGDLLILGTGSGASVGNANVGVFLGDDARLIVDNPGRIKSSDLVIRGVSGTGQDFNLGTGGGSAEVRADGEILINGISRGSGTLNFDNLFDGATLDAALVTFEGNTKLENTFVNGVLVSGTFADGLRIDAAEVVLPSIDSTVLLNPLPVANEIPAAQVQAVFIQGEEQAKARAYRGLALAGAASPASNQSRQTSLMFPTLAGFLRSVGDHFRNQRVVVDRSPVNEPGR